MKSEYPYAFACYNKSNIIREASTSGGIFTAISEYIIENYSGIVYGAAFDGDFNVVHKRICSVDGLSKLRGSKYPQSKIGGVFIDVRNDLNNNITVLFSGTPCQIEALHLFLGKKYENLYCLDFVCHGVASNGIWKGYVKELNSNNHLENIIFKSKPHGWKKWYFRVEYKERFYHVRGSMNKFMRSYLSCCNIRPSCYNCKFKGLLHKSDFTISDCWGLGEKDKDINDNRGLSALLLQNSKAVSLFEGIKDSIVYKRFPAYDLMEENWTAFKCVKPDSRRASFFEIYSKYGAVKALDRYFKPTIISWMHYYYRKMIGIEK